jgi:hypothetical protein
MILLCYTAGSSGHSFCYCPSTHIYQSIRLLLVNQKIMDEQKIDPEEMQPKGAVPASEGEEEKEEEEVTPEA